MTQIPGDLIRHLEVYQQTHVLAGWKHLSPAQRERFVEQLKSIDLAELAELFRRADQSGTTESATIEPLPVKPSEATAEERSLGEQALARGEVAALIVAGGQGSRLGFEKPKGMFPVGPVSGASLFQVHAEKVLARSRRHGKPLILLVMTSPATDSETREYFSENQYFGLSPADVIFFQQGVMPTVCANSGSLLLEDHGRLFLSPNGHGGTLTALAERGVLEELTSRGVKHVFYFQVDNPLVKIADPDFVGQHIAANSEASSKVVFKEEPDEKVGVFAIVNGRCGMIEYSDLPKEMATERERDGTLRFRAGNPAIHLFSVDFLSRVTRTGGLPYHVARKSVAHRDPETGIVVEPTKELNALKFERFIFDALPLAERWLAVETSRSAEFSPLKNAKGNDSPDSVRDSQVALYAAWLESAGIPHGGHTIEVSPLFALDAEELRARIPQGFRVDGPTHLR